MKYRKKPVVIEAWQFTFPAPVGSLPSWLAAAMENQRAWLGQRGDNNQTCMIIRTLEGDHRADLNDWIIRGVKGELYPCKPDIFEATYEPVEG
ncbi:hypothetical protein [Hyphomicrobium sp. MC1]|uniref:hypothetical protein n=1 Tax=Hyphomicrobium sp. (strain MC1) TaxID=717785 RepID=UPI000213DA93|nr:hypothetical protein [Hyphomicrobium sp. MC1]CCB64440.1 Uncharacterized 10.3 kDa protein in GP2-GP6 intergenic region [Hyphomicrobium sp. MC1]